jgi:DNA-binding PadR family transcriptional regulator
MIFVQAFRHPLPSFTFYWLFAEGKKHGHAIIKHISNSTKCRFVLSSGTPYGILAKLRTDGIILASPWLLLPERRPATP